MRLFGTDIQEKGKVVVCSYERLNELQCYQFLLNVLDVYDYAVIGMPNKVLKVIAAKNISPILTPLMAVRFAWRFCLPAAPYSEMLKGYEKGLIHLLLSAYLPGTD
ncbi:hypothetical protein [Serratia marcescens]|uniref:hypothetical protein n=1 Tax=Serratia marcescens TaxID=615 RepID=UPI0009F37114|nr:hypothetical protein [Serratia marcescens]OQV36041.1 hypothetical protein BV901_10745 [Serratia nematodiphila]